MATITARYNGVCRKCGASLPAGSKIEWSRGSGTTCHGGCKSQGADETAPFHLGGGSGYGCQGWTVGEVLHAWVCGSAVVKESTEGATEAWLYVVHASSRYYSEDGLSFGVGDESGRYYTASCRLATDEESAARRAERETRMAAEAARKALQEDYRRLFAFEEGEHVWGENGTALSPQGARVRWELGFNIYGGGVEFVAEEGGQWIWHLQNNGADGDDWSRNNIRTGGAGAIGLRYPATPERLAFLRRLPGGELIGKTIEEQKLEVIQQLHALTFHGSSASSLFEDAPLEFTHAKRAVWCNLGGVRVGLSLDNQDVWVLPPRSVTSELFDKLLNLFHYDSIALRYRATEQRVAAIRALWPAWVGTSVLGRFIVPGDARMVADNAADALRAATIWHVDVNEIEVTPEATISFASPGLADNKSGIIYWSDRKVQVCALLGTSLFSHKRSARSQSEYSAKSEAEFLAQGFPPIPEPAAQTMSIADAAVTLIRWAMPSQYWRENRRLHALLDVVSFSESKLNKKSRQGSSSGEEDELIELTIVHADGSEQTLYLVHTAWWCMGEDGDAGDDYSLHATLQEARAAFAGKKAA